MSLEGLKVLIDGYNLELQQGTGIKTYSITLLEALNQLGVSSTILTSRKIRSEELFSNAQIIRLPQCYRIANLLFKSIRIKQNLKIKQPIDIWHATYPLPISIKNTLKITTIHDLIPLKLPHLTLDNKRFFRDLIKSSLEDSEVIITVSQSTKNDLVSLFDYPAERIFVTYQPIALKTITEGENKPILEKYQLKKDNYILFVGAIEPKKNIKRLIEAYQKLSTGQSLVIIGKKAWLWKEELKNIEQSSTKIVLLDYVSSQDLQYLYKGASCFIFPSLYEGFGLPVLEAMNFGCPVITSNIASLPEVCGDAALYIDPYDTQDLAEKLEQLLGDNHLRAHLAQAGHQRAKLFSMERYIQEINRVYQKVTN